MERRVRRCVGKIGFVDLLRDKKLKKLKIVCNLLILNDRKTNRLNKNQ